MRRRRTVNTIQSMLVAALILSAARAGGQCLTLQRTINNPTPRPGEEFGGAVAISGNKVLVGTYNAESVYLFDAVSGAILRTFNNPIPENTDFFGNSVAISENYVLVGAHASDTGGAGAGSAYLFDAVSGSLLKTFNNPTPDYSDHFGFSVAVSGDNVLVGTEKVQSAYLFDAVSGSLLKTFNNPTPASLDGFGRSAAISGNNVLLGAFRDEAAGDTEGSAFLFDAVSGALLKTFANPTPAYADYFGYSVAILGNNVLVGAYLDDTGAKDAGSAYLFDAVSGSLLQTLLNPSPAEGDWFGYSVALSESNALVGALADNTGAENGGSAYLFDAVSGSLLQTFNNPSPAQRDEFGRSAAISGNTVVVGAFRDDAGAFNAGSAYLFAPSTCPSAAEILDYLLGRTSSPHGLDLNTDGVVDAADLARLLAGAS